MSPPDDFYAPRRAEMADTSGYLGFVVGFFGAAPFAWNGLTRSFEEDGGNATMGVIRFALALVAGGIATGFAGHVLGALAGRGWEWRHRARHPRAKPEAGPDRATLTGAPAADTVAAVARAWQRQATQAEVLLRRFDAPDEARDLPLGRFELVRLGGMSIGRVTCQPGWRWSTHVGPAVGARQCTVEHGGFVLSGEALVEFADGATHALTPGSLFHVPPRAHDCRVVGEAPFVALHLQGAERYAR